ncbi:alpha/beta hydrolase [Nodosilinea sp. P-1105]|uniref:alpha/beta hydrolase n=1 Tax=Nodosilinea sp. P-1105 TaxID=2546229 RepID=UPI0032420385
MQFGAAKIAFCKGPALPKPAGATLEAWNIESSIYLEGAHYNYVYLNYVYLLRNQQERRPSSGVFGPGEFTKLFREVLDTIDLIFRDGVDWKAFIQTLNQIQVEHGDAQLAIQAIENKGDGVVVVKLQAAPDSDQEPLHRSFMQGYPKALKAAERKYKAQLKAKDREIQIYHQQSANLYEIVKLPWRPLMTVLTTHQHPTADFILFAQHGWADNNRWMLALAQELATEATEIVAPSLNYAMTWLRMAPLIEAVDQIATAVIDQQPTVPLRIIGHSMGGLVWLEVLTRHPEWWPRVQALVLVASPVGGADLGRIIDPLQVGLGIAADLGRDRRPLAMAIAAAINTLVLAGNTDGGSDGTITVESTKVPNAQFVCLEGLSHADMRYHPAVVEHIHQFWDGQILSLPLMQHPLVERLRKIRGMTDAHLRAFDRAKRYLTLDDGTSLYVWRHPLGIDHVFVVDAEAALLYSGYVGWLHYEDFWQALRTIKAEQEEVL